MAELGRFARQLRARLWKPSVDQEVSSEIDFHLEMLTQEYIARGLAPDVARATARERFGDRARISETLHAEATMRDRSANQRELLDELRQDTRYALRQLRANPRFTLVALLTLALGLGASTTIFGIANAVLLRPLPFRDPSRLVFALETTPANQAFATSEPTFLDWRAQWHSVTDVTAISTSQPNLTGSSDVEQLTAAVVTHDFWRVLGIAPALGRGFTAEEDVAGGDKSVAVISDALWHRRYGGRPDILSQTIELDGVRSRIVGVMSATFDFPRQTDVWIPAAPSATWPRGDRRIAIAIGRLAPGATVAQADAELAQISKRIGEAYPQSNMSWGSQVRSLTELFITPNLRARVMALLFAVGLLLLMACVNVASLLLARAGVREQELAVRAALGAGRGRILRQLLSESIILSLIGGLLGVGLALAAVPVIRSTGSSVVSLLATMTIDWRVLSFSLIACVVTGAIFAAAPAWKHLRPSTRHSGGFLELLRSGTRVADAGRLRAVLIVSSVGVATVMLVSAGLVAGSFVKLLRTDLGFTAEHVLTGNIVLPRERYDREHIALFYRQVIERVSAIPGVTKVGGVNIAPYSGGNTGMGWARAENAPENTSEYRTAGWRVVTPDYFSTLGIPLLAGRQFDATDLPSMPRRIIINATLAQLGWPNESPVGKQMKLGNRATVEIVGVVGATRVLSVDSLPAAAMYFPSAQFPWPEMWLTIRAASTADVAQLTSAVRRELKALDPNIPFAQVQPLTQLVALATSGPRLTMLVFGIFAVAALVLVAAGLYGVVSYTVSQRTREIGVRLALGAEPSRVVRSVIRQGMQLAVVGVAVGSVAAFGLVRVLRTILYETQPTDAPTFLVVAVVLVALGALAAAAPARRAARLDPVRALRAE